MGAEVDGQIFLKKLLPQLCTFKTSACHGDHFEVCLLGCPPRSPAADRPTVWVNQGGGGGLLQNPKTVAHPAGSHIDWRQPPCSRGENFHTPTILVQCDQTWGTSTLPTFGSLRTFGCVKLGRPKIGTTSCIPFHQKRRARPSLALHTEGGTNSRKGEQQGNNIWLLPPPRMHKEQEVPQIAKKIAGKITSKRGCQIKCRRRRRIPPFFGVVRAAYPDVWFLTSNPL